MDSTTYGQEKNQIPHRRLSRLFDRGEYAELFPASDEGVVIAVGEAEGVRVYAYAHDPKRSGGSVCAADASRIARVQELALKEGAPIVALADSGGARIQEGVRALNGLGEIFARNVRSSGRIPQIAMVFGACAGGAAYSAALMDFVFIIAPYGRMFVTGPAVVSRVTGEQVDGDRLGGSRVHGSVSGVAHAVCQTEQEGFSRVRRLLSLLCRPQVPTEEEHDPLLPDGLVPQDPHKGYDMIRVARCLADASTLWECQDQFARNCITALGRIGGRTVGIVANQPRFLAGCIDLDASDKMARFIRVCDSFSIPLVTLVDTPGYLLGLRQEEGGIIRHGAKLLYAYCESTVPKVTVVVRKAYGGAYIAMCSRSLGADRVFAWPDARIAVMGEEASARIACSKALRTASDSELLLRQTVRSFREAASPRFACSGGYVDRIIRPEETRRELRRFLSCAAYIRTPCGHGNMPL